MDQFDIISYIVAVIACLYGLILIGYMSFLFKYRFRLFVIRGMIPTLLFVTALVIVVYYQIRQIEKNLVESKLKITEDLADVNKCLVKIAQIDSNYYVKELDELIKAILKTKWVFEIQILGCMITILLYLLSSLKKKF